MACVASCYAGHCCFLLYHSTLLFAMEVTGQLRLEKLSKKKGTAPTQLTFC
ncbi:hypothetical protein Hsw_2380 [Hymenobacter swuensis DY53]|uniref:Uncharacterized protein n=1 Tax=Hymenobacter swuensis DY53 TaxID=1227739 RepID=W8F8E8_9BACT|nr:hypothetical protein Hsw_2380 [Hymenobacter swuensis DY53]